MRDIVEAALDEVDRHRVELDAGHLGGAVTQGGNDVAPASHADDQHAWARLRDQVGKAQDVAIQEVEFALAQIEDRGTSGAIVRDVAARTLEVLRRRTAETPADGVGKARSHLRAHDIGPEERRPAREKGAMPFPSMSRAISLLRAGVKGIDGPKGAATRSSAARAAAARRAPLPRAYTNEAEENSAAATSAPPGGERTFMNGTATAQPVPLPIGPRSTGGPPGARPHASTGSRRGQEEEGEGRSKLVGKQQHPLAGPLEHLHGVQGETPYEREEAAGREGGEPAAARQRRRAGPGLRSRDARPEAFPKPPNPSSALEMTTYAKWYQMVKESTRGSA